MKNKKQKVQKKTRIDEIRFDFGKDVVISGMEEKDGQFIFYDQNGKKLDPVFIEVGDAYLRDGKNHKVLSRARSRNDQIVLDPNRALDKFDHLFAVDTNSVDLNGTKISVAVPIGFKLEFTGPVWNAKYQLLDAFEFRNCVVNPEIIAWKNLIERITSGISLKDEKVAIIVDSELNKHTDINKRKEPIIAEFYLPENFELVYASSDTGKENPLNKIISICDSKARNILNRIKDSNDTISILIKNDTGFYSHYCYWTPPNQS